MGNAISLLQKLSLEGKSVLPVIVTMTRQPGADEAGVAELTPGPAAAAHRKPVTRLMTGPDPQVLAISDISAYF